MTDDSESTLIVADGGITTAVTCAALAERRLAGDGPFGPAAVWIPGDLFHHRTRAARTRATEILAQAYRLDVVATPGDARRSQLGVLNATSPLGPAAAALAAASVALERGATRVLWACDNPPPTAQHPTAQHPAAHDTTTKPRSEHDQEHDASVAAIAQRLDRCVLVERLVMNETGVLLRIESPHADLADPQIADLALDLAVPVDRLWWWGEEDDHPAKRRWVTHLRELGWRPDATTEGAVTRSS